MATLLKVGGKRSGVRAALRPLMTLFWFSTCVVTDPAAETSQIGLATTTIPLALFALFQMKFAIITPSLITGAFAERVHFTGYLLFMMLWTIIVLLLSEQTLK